MLPLEWDTFYVNIEHYADFLLTNSKPLFISLQPGGALNLYC